MAEVTSIPMVALHDGVRIPQLGLGVFLVPPEDTQRIVEEALEAGYRHIDTASAYGNEAGVGAAVEASGIPRDEVFVTTKLRNPDQGYDSTLRAFERSLEALGMEHVDLYLIHWPQPEAGLFVETWRAFERIHDEGRARSIGVSNFRIEDLERLREAGERRPTVNQVELHPRLHQNDLRAWHRAHHVATEAWSPLARGDLLEDPTIVSLARRHERSPAQVILRWHIQLGNVVIPKTATTERLHENLRLFDFELDEEDMEAIAGLDGGEQIGPDPAGFVEQ
jgi:diketogulonate reductase-like aldo/keto reductase